MSDAKTADAELLFGHTPAENPVALGRRLLPLFEALQASTGMTFRARVPTTYDAVLDGLERGEYDLATIGPELFIEAMRRGAPYRPLVAPLRAGRGAYHSVFVTTQGSEIRELGDLVGRRVAFVNRRSTAGYLMPRSMLRHARLMAELEFGFLGSYENVMSAVLEGRYDAGTVFDGAWNGASGRNLGAGEQLRIFAVSPPIPNEPTVISTRIEASTAAKLLQAYLHLRSSPAGRAALEALGNGVDAFVEADTDTYIGLRDSLYLPGTE